MSRQCCHEAGCDHQHGEEERGSEAQGGLGHDLYPYINVDQIRTLNVVRQITNVVKPHSQRGDRSTNGIASDADAELIVFIPFREVVKMRGFVLLGSGDAHSPSVARLFTNRNDVDFDVANRLDPQQEVALAAPGPNAGEEEIAYPLRGGRFTAVSSVSVHLPKNFLDDDDEATVVHHIGFLGESTKRPVTDGIVTAVYEVTPNLADHKAALDALKGASHIA